MTTPAAYTLDDAARASGYSVDVIRRAVRAGDLATVTPVVGGKRISRPVILASELTRWLTA